MGERVVFCRAGSVGAGVDPEMAQALRELNAVPGVRSRQSCQGRRPGRKAHSEFAYVLFAEPLPLAVGEALASALGEIARVEDDAIHCRWSSRNAEFVARLTELARELSRQSARASFERWEVPRAAVSSRLRAHLRRGRRGRLCACLPCRELLSARESPVHAVSGRCAAVPLSPPGDQWRESLFRNFLATEQPPIDPRLVAAEGTPAVLQRCFSGDFGTGCRRRWLALEREAVRTVLRREPREAIAAWRRAGGPLREPDYLLLPGRIAFVWKA